MVHGWILDFHELTYLWMEKTHEQCVKYHVYISSIMDKTNVHEWTSSIIHEIAMHCYVNALDLILEIEKFIEINYLHKHRK
jgi:hypothetical protein